MITRVEAFRPLIDSRQKYAVAVPIRTGVVPIQTYENLKDLRGGFDQWSKYASDRGITRPVPVEFLDSDGRCRVLLDMIRERDNPLKN